MSGRLYGVCLSNTADEVRWNLPVLAQYARAEMQIELGRTLTNAAGDAFAPDDSAPLVWLHQQGVEAWGYADPWWPPNPAALGNSFLPPEEDAFWLRRELIAAIEANDWWLYGTKDGQRSKVLGSYNRPCPDMTNDDFLRFTLDLLLSAHVRRVRFDDGFVHRHGYYRPWKAERADMALATSAAWLYDRLRDAGVEVVVNGGWEPFDPKEGTTPEQWTYPMLDHVDGVVIEFPIGFARWDNGRWFALSEEQLAGVVRFWRGQGKRVVVAAKYLSAAGGSWEAHRAKWLTFAQANECEVAVARSWNTAEAIGQAEVEDTGGEETGGEAMAQRLGELEAALLEMAGRLQALETWRAGVRGVS